MERICFSTHARADLGGSNDPSQHDMLLADARFHTLCRELPCSRVHFGPSTSGLSWACGAMQW